MTLTPSYVIRYDDELYHYGTKGMKWYQRLYQNKDGTLTALGKIHYAREEARTEKRAANNSVSKGRLGSRQISKLSNDELKERITRLQNEKTFKSMQDEMRPTIGNTLKTAIGSSVKKKVTNDIDKFITNIGNKAINSMDLEGTPVSMLTDEQASKLAARKETNKKLSDEPKTNSMLFKDKPIDELTDDQAKSLAARTAWNKTITGKTDNNNDGNSNSGQGKKKKKGQQAVDTAFDWMGAMVGDNGIETSWQGDYDF